MKVYTKIGDKGQTRFGKGLLKKSDSIFEVLGALDEAQASIGFAYEFISKEVKNYLEETMTMLYKVMGFLYNRENVDGQAEFITSLIEEHIDNIMEIVELPNKFLLPIGCKNIAALHLARTAVRRAERTIVTYKDDLEISNSIIAFINRLSDYLYILTLYILKFKDTLCVGV